MPADPLPRIVEEAVADRQPVGEELGRRKRSFTPSSATRTRICRSPRNGYLSCTPGTSDLSGECEAPQALPSGSLPMKEIPLRRGLTGEFAGENGEEVEIGSIQVDSVRVGDRPGCAAESLPEVAEHFPHRERHPRRGLVGGGVRGEGTPLAPLQRGAISGKQRRGFHHSVTCTARRRLGRSASCWNRRKARLCASAAWKSLRIEAPPPHDPLKNGSPVRNIAWGLLTNGSRGDKGRDYDSMTFLPRRCTRTSLCSPRTIIFGAWVAASSGVK